VTYNALCSRHGFRPEVGVLPGWDWLLKHEHDLDGWQPTVSMTVGGIRYNMSCKRPGVLIDVVKANRR